MIGGFDFNGNGKIDATDHAIGYQIYKDTTSSNDNTTDGRYYSGSQKKSGGSFIPVLTGAALLAIFIPELEAILLLLLLVYGFIKLITG